MPDNPDFSKDKAASARLLLIYRWPLSVPLTAQSAYTTYWIYLIIDIQALSCHIQYYKKQTLNIQALAEKGCEALKRTKYM